MTINRYKSHHLPPYQSKKDANTYSANNNTGNDANGGWGLGELFQWKYMLMAGAAVGIIYLATSNRR